MDKWIEDENLKDTVPYLNNINVVESTPAEHDENSQKVVNVIQSWKLTLSISKSIMCVFAVNVLGFCIGEINTNPDSDPDFV